MPEKKSRRESTSIQLGQHGQKCSSSKQAREHHVPALFFLMRHLEEGENPMAPTRIRVEVESHTNNRSSLKSRIAGHWLNKLYENQNKHPTGDWESRVGDSLALGSSHSDIAHSLRAARMHLKWGTKMGSIDFDVTEQAGPIRFKKGMKK
jgi:hypothetical protein